QKRLRKFFFFQAEDGIRDGIGMRKRLLTIRLSASAMPRMMKSVANRIGRPIQMTTVPRPTESPMMTIRKEISPSGNESNRKTILSRVELASSGKTTLAGRALIGFSIIFFLTLFTKGATTVMLLVWLPDIAKISPLCTGIVAVANIF